MGALSFFAAPALAGFLSRPKRWIFRMTMLLVKAGPSFFPIAPAERPSLCNHFSFAIRSSVQLTMARHSRRALWPLREG